MFNVSDYAALLTSTIYSMHKKDAGNASSINSLGQTATGRFILHKRNLYYSFYTSMYPLPTRPKTIQFVDNSDTIVEEQQVNSKFMKSDFCNQLYDNRKKNSEFLHFLWYLV